MTDKKKTLLWIIEDPQDLPKSSSALLNRIVAGGNSQMLTLRQASLTEDEGIFNAVTSLSQISGGDLAYRLG